MVRRRAFWMATVLAVLAATSAWAAEDVFHVIPSDALAFVAANRIGETSAKIEKVARQVGAKPVKLLDMIKEHTGDIKGLDEARGAALVVMPGKDAKDEPSRVLLVPVTDYKKFLESWNAKPTEKIVEVTIADEPMLIARRGDYAAISRKQVGDIDFRPGLEKLLNAKRSVADEYPQMLSWLTENDVVAVATSHGLKRASEAMQEQLQQMKDIVARMNMDEDASAPVMLLETYVKIFQDAEKGIDLIAVAARVDKQGNLHVTKRIRFSEEQRNRPVAGQTPADREGPAGGHAGRTIRAGRRRSLVRFALPRRIDASVRFPEADLPQDLRHRRETGRGACQEVARNAQGHPFRVADDGAGPAGRADLERHAGPLPRGRCSEVPR